MRSGAGFRFVDHTGAAVSEHEAARARALVIPPAWREVWIAKEANAHIQAVGTDEAGRRQYTYHADWSKRQDKGKFARALQLAESLPRARARVTQSLRRSEIDRERVLAVSFRFLDLVAPRVGNARYFVTNGSRGADDAATPDAVVEGDLIRLSFPAKSGKRAELSLRDAELASLVDELALGRSRAALLSYRRGRRRVPLTPGDVNAYVRSLTGGPFSAKDFRTLRGTILAAESLAKAARWAARASARRPSSPRSAARPRRWATLRRSLARATSTPASSRSTARGARWTSAGPRMPRSGVSSWGE